MDDLEFKAKVVSIYDALCRLTKEDDQTAVAVAAAMVMGAAAKVEGKTTREFMGLAEWAAKLAELDG